MDLQQTRKIVAQNLKKARLHKKYSQRELAELLGYSHTHISDIERGSATASHALLRKASEVLGVSMESWTASDHEQLDKIARVEGTLERGGDLNEALTTHRSP